VPFVRTEICIDAPLERVFDLARDVRIHAATTASTGERVVEAPESGLLQLGDEVEFEAVHFGVRQRLRSRIVEYDRPHRFVDEMQRGAFRRLRHIHRFEERGGATHMVDELDFASPFGLLGALVDRLFLAQYMRRFLMRRNLELKRLAERERD
jgi:ligand-binding SRPBCC domain-containing protein